MNTAASHRGHGSFRITGFFLALLLSGATLAFAGQTLSSVPGESRPAAAIIINSSSDDSASRSLPPVVFNHDTHTKALGVDAQSCSSCHDRSPSDADKDYSYPFKNTGSATSSAERKNAFHNACFSCHADMRQKSAPSGPLEAQCRTCHTPRLGNTGNTGQTTEAPRPADGGFDRTLHAAHINSPLIQPPASTAGTLENLRNCASCHHPVKTKLPGTLTADSCRSCHGQSPEAKDIPFARVAHNTCISCHASLDPTGVKAPLTCAACHERARPADSAAAPRLDAGQPDLRLMMPRPRTEAEKKAPPPAGTMVPVAFNHALHENAAPSCRSCHHKTMDSCSSCHTPTGSEKGRNITTAQAMHAPTAPNSCVGCHEKQKTTQPQCAGCHTPRPKSSRPDCASCHTLYSGADKAMAEDGSLLVLNRSGRTELARASIAERTAAAQPLAPTIGPETVRIGGLSQEYEGVNFPHKAILEALARGINEKAPHTTGLHAREQALCQSCHHNSPPSATPPRCASCHSAEQPAGRLPADGRPLLKAAYHQQCMSCHQRMNIRKPADTDCAACHIKRSPAS